MFTSLYPSVHRAGVSTRRPLADGHVTLAEVFRDNGYRTAAFVAGAQVAKVWNLSQGFEIYQQSSNTYEDFWYPNDLPGILGRAADWIGQHRDEPLFCFIHSYVVHMPFAPASPYDRMFDEGYTGSLPFAITDELGEINRTPRTPDEPDVRHVVSLYDGEIRYMDHHLGRFLERLADLGLDDETIVAFTSDHGEEFAEHGQVGLHSHSLYDELLHVPLIIRVPGTDPQTIDKPVRLLDLAPTLLASVGLDPGKAPFQGVNVLGEDFQHDPDLPVFSEMPYKNRYHVSLRTNGHKIIAYDPNRFAIFDLREDPAETVDLLPFIGRAADHWKATLREFAYTNHAIATRDTGPIELDPETEQQLRALGYLD